MEKYGYLIADLYGENYTDFLYINNSLFENITDCIQNALLKNLVDGPKRVLYFKILQNSEIVSHIHEDCNFENYGFCHLRRTNSSERFTVLTTYKSLVNRLLDCVLKAKIYECESSELPDTPNFHLKIGYFKVLNDTEIVQLLHRP